MNSQEDEAVLCYALGSLERKENMAQETDPSREELLKGAISRQKKYLSESVEVTDFLDHLLSEGVIEQAKEEEIQACLTNKGKTNAASMFWSMVLRDEIPVVRFVEIVKRKTKPKHWICGTLDKYVAKVKSGEWPLYGEPDFKKIGEMLRKKYLNEAWMKLEVIPDEEKAVIKLSQELLTPDFETEVINPNRLYSTSHYQTEVLSYYYEGIEDKHLHDILSHVSCLKGNCVLSDLQPNLVELLGVAGTGKTTAVKKLTYTWATDRNQLLKNYDLIFVIPFRDVTTDNLMDIVCDMQLLPKSEKKSFGHFLQSSEQARKVLFILDGVDENDLHEGTDLFNLVTGRLFPNVTVLITARPEGKSLGIIDKKPRVKVTLHGTDKASVDRMLANAVTGSSEEEIEAFKQRYEEKLSDKSLLFIPLYLTLLCFVFKEDIAKGIKCVDLKIPETMTRLFNAIMHVILGRWLQKRQHNNVAISFRDSPLGMDSTVPSEIKRILYAIGRVCYKGILGSKYQFSDQDAKECYLDMENIKQSGLFTVGRDDSGEIFFTKHKQIQEYLASLYLAHEGTKEPCFHEILHKEENKGRGLIEVMTDCNMVKLTQFACGLSGDILKSMLDVATSNFRILFFHPRDPYDTYSEHIDIFYEAALFTERNVCDLSAVSKQTFEGCDELIKYFFKAEMRHVSQDEIKHLVFFPRTCLRNMIRVLVYQDKCTHLCANLLNRLYGLKLRPSGCEQSTGQAVKYEVCNCVCDDSDIKLCLDTLQVCLLNEVQIHNATSVSVESDNCPSDVVTRLLNIFPDLTKLCIHTFPSFLQNTPEELHRNTIHTKLKHLNIQSKTEYIMSDDDIYSLQKQSSLITLKVKNVRYFFKQGCWWNQLQNLSSGDISPEVLCALLQANSTTLRSLDTKVYVPSACEKYMAESLKSLSKLQELRLSGDGITGDLAPVLAECLPALSNLHTLEIWNLEVTSDVVTPLAEGIKTLMNLKDFTLGGIYQEYITTDLAIQCLAGLPQIKKFSLWLDDLPMEERLIEVLNSLHHLEILNDQTVSFPVEDADVIRRILYPDNFY